MEEINARKSIKVVVTGPESTGKSTLSELLAKYFDAIWLPEYAREYLESIDRPYVENDLLQIAFGQKERENSVSFSRKLHFVDTSFEVLKVWSEWKYHRCDPIIQTYMDHHLPDLYLLMFPDLPWQEDPLRETPNDREALFEIYEALLKKTKVPYFIVLGTHQQRIDQANEQVSSFINLQK